MISYHLCNSLHIFINEFHFSCQLIKLLKIMIFIITQWLSRSSSLWKKKKQCTSCLWRLTCERKSFKSSCWTAWLSYKVKTIEIQWPNNKICDLLRFFKMKNTSYFKSSGQFYMLSLLAFLFYSCAIAHTVQLLRHDTYCPLNWRISPKI